MDQDQNEFDGKINNELDVNNPNPEINLNSNNNNKQKSGRFNVMPDEFFSFKYQQSRVKKEQQMKNEKDAIDKKKRMQEERVKKILEKEKIEKAKKEQRDAMRKTKEEERMIMFKKKEEERKKNEEVIRAKREEEFRIKQQKDDENKKIYELQRKSLGEKRIYEKNSKEELRQELERINKLKNSGNQSNLSKDELREFNKKIEQERRDALKKMKEQERLNRIEQKKIAKEAKEEEKKKKEEERIAKENLQKTLPRKLDLSFVKNLDERMEVKNSKSRKKSFIVILALAVVLLVFFSDLVIKSLKENKAIENNNNNNTTTGVDVLLPGNNIVTNDNESYGYSTNNTNTYGNVDNGVDVIDVIGDNSYGTTDIPIDSNTTNNNQTQIGETEFFKTFFPKNSFVSGADSDSDYITDAEEILYDTKSGSVDSDNDGYYDAEEIANLYDPRSGNMEKLINSSLIKSYSKNSVKFFYPKTFIVNEDLANNIINILPNESSSEYFRLNILAYSGNDFMEFVARDLGVASSDLVNLNFVKPGYIYMQDKIAYIKSGTKVFKVSYINNTGEYSYWATFLMVLKSLTQ